MSHQDRKSKTRIVVNHASLEQAVNELFTTKAFRQVKTRKGSKWTARMLVTVALFWAWSGCTGLKERFQQAAKLAGKILRWLPDPGRTYQGFIKQLQKWHVKLQLACASELRVLMKQDLFDQWEIAGFVVIAGDGSRVELPRTQSNEAVYSPKRKKEGEEEQAKSREEAKQPRRKRRQANNKAEATIGPIDRQEGEQPADVADAVLARGNGFAVGLAHRPLGFERAAAPAGNVGRIAGKHANCGGCGLCGLRVLAGSDGRRTQFCDSRRGERAAAEEVGVCSRIRSNDLPLAQGRRQEGIAAFGVACCVGSRWKTADVSGDQRAEQGAFERSADRGHLQSALGCRGILQNFQADFRATQASQPCGGERSLGNRLVVGGVMECLSVGATRVGSNRRGSASTEPRGCDQGDSAGDAPLPHPRRTTPTKPFGRCFVVRCETITKEIHRRRLATIRGRRNANE